MTTTTYHRGLTAAPSSSRPAAAKPGFLQRAYGRLVAARHRRAEQLIAHYIERQGGRMTDDLERKIANRFTDMG